MTITIQTHSIHQRSFSFDSAYNHKNHITFVNKKTHNNREFNDDNITLVPTEYQPSVISSLLSQLEATYTKYSPAIVLENKGNTARDHLANERTYLAWFRTSISLITLGIGIIQVYHVSTAHHKRFGRALGLIFVMTSILFLYFGNVRYFHAQWALQHGNFPASRGVVTWASFCILVLFVGMFTVMILESIQK